MKKRVRNIISFLLIIGTFFIFQDRVVASENLSCSQIPVNFCPVPGIDYQGYACKISKHGNKSKECVRNENAKNCLQIYESTGTCKKTDDYGNTCGMQYNGSIKSCEITKKAVYEPLRTCGEYAYTGSCPSEDYKGDKCSSGTNGDCYVSNKKCENITTTSVCISTSGCAPTVKKFPLLNTFVDSDLSTRLSSGLLGTKMDSMAAKDLGMYCGKIIYPTSSSKECSKITKVDECILRIDCLTVGFPGTNNWVCYKNPQFKKNYSINGTLYTFKCSDVKHLTQIWLIIRISAPFLILIFGSLDFLKAVMANDEKRMKESRGRFLRRLVAFILLIVLPFTIQFVFETMGTNGSENMCMVKCIVTNDTSSKGCD